MNCSIPIQFTFDSRINILRLSQPKLEDVFELIDSRPYILTGWISQFVDCKKILSMKSEFQKFERALAVVSNESLSGFVNAALQLQEYMDSPTHSNDILLDHVACSESELNRILSILQKNRIIEFNGKKYYPKFQSLSFSLLPNKNLRPLYQHVHSFIDSRFKSSPASSYPESNKKTINFSMASVRIAPLSKRASKKAAELVSKFHHEMGKIVEEDSEPKTNVQVVLIHSVPTSINLPSR